MYSSTGAYLKPPPARPRARPTTLVICDQLAAVATTGKGWDERFVHNDGGGLQGIDRRRRRRRRGGR